MTKKIILFLVVSVFLVSGAFAGWQTVTTGVNENLNSVYFIDNTTGYAVGDSGWVVKITVSGTTYSYSSKQMTGTPNLRDVIFPSSKEGYVVGDNGSIYKTINEGDTYTKLTLPAAIGTATIECGSFSGTRRAFTAWTGSASYLFYSEDSGTTFTAPIEIPGFEVHGVALTSTATWEWGKISNANQYGLVRDSSILVFPENQTDKKVNNIYILPSGAAVAVGDSGVLLTKEADAASNTWKIVQTGLSNNLNSSSFVSSSIGWIVADGGKIYYTKNGGTSFYEYPDSNLNLSTTKFRDISIYTLGTVAYAYAVGDSGKMVTLASPSISGISPNSRKQGWVGTVEVTGAEFLNPLTVQITGEGMTVFSSTAESASKLSSIIIISPTATVSTRDVIVTNPDSTTVTSTAAFAVTVSTGNVTIEDTRFNGNIPQVLPLVPTAKNISTTPTISFEVSSAAGFSATTMNAKILVYRSSGYSNVFFVPASAVTNKPPTSANVNYTVTDTLATGSATIELYAEDSAGNVGRRGVTVEVVNTVTEGGQVQYTTGNETSKAFVKDPVWNMVGPTTIQVQVKGNYPSGVGVLINTALNGDIAYRKVFPTPIKAKSVDGVEVANKINITIRPEEIATVNKRATLALITIYNPAIGNAVTGHGKCMFLPKGAGVNW